MNQKGKVFSLIAVSGAMLFSFAVIGKNFDFLGVKADNLNTTVEDVIDFNGADSKKTEFKVVNDKNVSRTTTKQGDYVYMVNDSQIRPSSGALTTFRGTFESSYDLGTIVFARDADASELYQFQNISGISIVSNYKISDVLIKASDDGINFYNLDEISITEKDGDDYVASLTFDQPIQDGYLMLEETTTPLTTAQFKRVILSYSCENSYVPAVKHSIGVEPTSNGSINADTIRKHKKGETVSFSVQPADGYIVDEVYTIPETDLSVSGYNYSFAMPEDDVSINATFKLAPQVAYNVSAASVTGGSVSFERNQYYSNESVAFTVTPVDPYEILAVTTDPVLALSGDDGSYSFIMPSEDVEVIPSYKAVTSLSLSGDYETEFDVDDTFTSEGLVVTANYSNGDTKVLNSSEYSISSPDMSSGGTKSVTVSYKGVSASYNINVIAPATMVGIEVSGNYKVNYFINDTVSHEGVVVSAVYSDGTRVVLDTGYTFTDPDLSYGSGLGKKVTVNYLTYSTTYEIKLFVLNSITLNGTSVSSNTSFKYGDQFSLKGITVTGNFKNCKTGTSDTISKDVTSEVNVTGYNMTATGYQTVTVSYDDGYNSDSDTYRINVSDYISRITYAAGSSAKTTYIVNEWFDKTGFTIYGEKASGATHTDVTSLATFETVQFTEAGTYNVRVSYTDVDDIFIPVTVEEPVTYLLTINQPSNGSIVGTPGSYQAGTTINLTVTANEGYEIKEVYYNDHVVISGTGSSYSFEMPACAVDIYARIEQQSSEKTLYEVLSETVFDGNYPTTVFTGSFVFSSDGSNNTIVQYLTGSLGTASYGCDYTLVKKSGNVFTVSCSNIHNIVSKVGYNAKLANMSLFEVEFASDLQSVVNITYECSSYGYEFNWQK